ncbi:MAG: NADH:ubiquinone oxidoreductase subunit NDUFA12 [Alphaproteobacteria bacterium]|nr:NADH:ubiquinone oxidoreductase subunit NDUFA12 [Alphaproteobacteria bacterium]
MSAHISLLTWWRGKLVGQDTYGNRYYQDRRPPKTGKARRWVIYQGMAEASKVPSDWHGWLHYTCDSPPLADVNKAEWQKAHEPNKTGTVHAYKPKGFAKTGKHTPKKDFEPWDPKG